jgi:hypothetical protein
MTGEGAIKVGVGAIIDHEVCRIRQGRAGAHALSQPYGTHAHVRLEGQDGASTCVS